MIQILFAALSYANNSEMREKLWDNHRSTRREYNKRHRVPRGNYAEKEEKNVRLSSSGATDIKRTQKLGNSKQTKKYTPNADLDFLCIASSYYIFV